MSDSYLGIQEVVWTAWEAIGTVLAVGITLLVLLGSKILNYFYSPDIKASEPDIKYTPPQEHTGTRGKIQLSWKIHNYPKHLYFGKMAVNVITRFWFDKKEHEGWTYSGRVGPLPILPKNENWTQHTKELKGELEPTEYKLILVFYQVGLTDREREKVIGHEEYNISWSPKLQTIF